jgi:hypothetical protein
MKNILGLMVFHRPFEVSERFQRDHVDSSILEFCCYPYALLSEASGEVFQQFTLEQVFILLRQGFDHGYEVIREFEDASIASFLWSHSKAVIVEVWVYPLERLCLYWSHASFSQ